MEGEHSGFFSGPVKDYRSSVRAVRRTVHLRVRLGLATRHLSVLCGDRMRAQETTTADNYVRGPNDFSSFAIAVLPVFRSGADHMQDLSSAKATRQWWQGLH